MRCVHACEIHWHGICIQAAGEAIQEQHANRLAASEAFVMRLQRALDAVSILVTAASLPKPPSAGASTRKAMTDDLVSQAEVQQSQPSWSNVKGSNGMTLGSPLQPQHTKQPIAPTEAASSALAPSATHSNTSGVSSCSYDHEADSGGTQHTRSRHLRSKHDSAGAAHSMIEGAAVRGTTALMHLTFTVGDCGPAAGTAEEHDSVVEGVVAEIQRFIATAAMATAAADRLSACQHEEARHHTPLYCGFAHYRIYFLACVLLLQLTIGRSSMRKSFHSLRSKPCIKPNSYEAKCCL